MVKRILAVLVFLLALPALALAAEQPLDDPALEARARALFKELRCVVCQSESIDTSAAGIAQDMRILVRERIATGESDAEIRGFLVDRYGDYVLFRPPFRPATWLLWLAPALALAAGGFGVAVYLRRRSSSADDEPLLDAAERARLAHLLEEDSS